MLYMRIECWSEILMINKDHFIDFHIVWIHANWKITTPNYNLSDLIQLAKFMLADFHRKAIGMLWVIVISGWKWDIIGDCSLANCKTVQMPHSNLPATPVALTSAPRLFQPLPCSPGTRHSALWYCKSFVGCSGMPLQVWSCIEGAKIFDW